MLQVFYAQVLDSMEWPWPWLLFFLSNSSEFETEMSRLPRKSERTPNYTNLGWHWGGCNELEWFCEYKLHSIEVQATMPTSLPLYLIDDYTKYNI